MSTQGRVARTVGQVLYTHLGQIAAASAAFLAAYILALTVTVILAGVIDARAHGQSRRDRSLSNARVIELMKIRRSRTKVLKVFDVITGVLIGSYVGTLIIILH